MKNYTVYLKSGSTLVIRAKGFKVADSTGRIEFHTTEGKPDPDVYVSKSEVAVIMPSSEEPSAK